LSGGSTFRASGPPSNLAELARDLFRLKQAMERGQPHIIRQELHAEPDKIVANMEVMADGTNWDPGSGAGLYRRNTTNTAWVLIEAGGVLTSHLADTTDAHDASAISFVAGGTIAATDVQAAVSEVATDAAAALAAHEAAADPHPGYLTAAEGNAAYQPLDADLTSWAAVTRAAGFDTFTTTPTSVNLKALVTDETGSGSLVFATSPALVTPDLGTPSAATLTNATGLPISTGVSGLAAGVASFLATPSSANLRTAMTDESGTGVLLFASGALGTPASGTLTNCTGLPISTGVSGLAANVATFLATPSSANLLAAVTDETGSGSLVFATSPSLTTPTANTLTLSAAAPQLIILETDQAADAGRTVWVSSAGQIALQEQSDAAALQANRIITTRGVGGTLAGAWVVASPYQTQAGQTTKSAAATLTAAELLTWLIQYTGAAANLTLPTAANMDAGVSSVVVNNTSFDFSVINTGSGAATMVTAAGWTLTGAMVVTNGTSGRFRARKTGTSTWTLYRIS
jgi:hypothetical protein